MARVWLAWLAWLVLAGCAGRLGGLPGEKTGTPKVALAFFDVEPPPFPATTAGTLRAVAVADVDGDGDVDVLGAKSDGPGWIARNDGSGSFTVEPGPGWSNSARVLLAQDFDGDGALDVFVGAKDGDQLWKQQGGVFSDATPTAFADAKGTTTSVALGDLDGDGALDLLIGSNGAVPLRIFLRRGSSFERAPSQLEPQASSPVTSLGLADVDGDGDLDALVATGDGVHLFVNQAGLLSSAKPIASTPDVRHVLAADVNGDLMADVLLIGSGQDRLLLGDGRGSFLDVTLAAMPFDVSEGRHAALADLDRDGDLDLVIANHDKQSRLYLYQGGRFLDETPRLPQRKGAAIAFAAADVDKDADVDLLLFDATGPSRLYLSVPPSM